MRRGLEVLKVQYSTVQYSTVDGCVGGGGGKNVRKLAEDGKRQANKVEVAPGVAVGSLRRFRAALIGPNQGLPKRPRLRL